MASLIDTLYRRADFLKEKKDKKYCVEKEGSREEIGSEDRDPPCSLFEVLL